MLVLFQRGLVLLLLGYKDTGCLVLCFCNSFGILGKGFEVLVQLRDLLR